MFLKLTVNDLILLWHCGCIFDHSHLVAFRNQLHTGHEGNEEKHEVEEGQWRGSASNESHEGNEESNEGDEGDEIIALQGDFNAGSAWVI